MERVIHRLRLVWEWWGTHWLRVQAIATPIGSLLVTLWLSQGEGVGRWWNSQSEFEVAATFASAGILFYTASVAALESGVVLVVLGLQIKEYFENKQLDKGAVIGAEAERQRQETGETFAEAYKRLKKEGWKPPAATAE